MRHGTRRRSLAALLGWHEAPTLDAPSFEAWRPHVEPKWDVLRRGQLPPTDGMALQHRLRPGTRTEQRRLAVRLGVLGLLGAWLVSGVVQLLGPVLVTPGVLGVLLVLGVGCGLWPLLRGMRREVIGMTAASGVLLFALLVLIQAAAAAKSRGVGGLSCVLTVALCAWLVDAWATHFLSWMLINPLVPEPVRLLWQAAWGRRFTPGALRALRQDEEDTASQRACQEAVDALVDYRLGFAVLLVAGLLWWKAWPPGLIVVLPLLLGLGVAGWPRASRSQPLSWRTQWAVLGEALVSWLTYGHRQGITAPGVWQSPIGPWLGRVGLSALTLGLLAAWSPVTSADVAHHLAAGVGAAWDTLRVTELPAQLSASLRDGETLRVWAQLLGDSLLGLLFPVTVLLAAMLATASRFLALASAALEGEGAAEQRNITPWEALVERMCASTHPLEHDHLFLGLHSVEDYPVLVPLAALSEHAHILGRSGSGKTHLAVLPILTQLIERTPRAVVILDLKGDRASFEGCRLAAARAGRPFKYFTNERGDSSYVFNPFQQVDPQSISVPQVCQIFLRALDLNHGQGYGTGYFSARSREWLTRTLERFPQILSFEELVDKTTASEFFENPVEKRDAFELVATIRDMARIPALNFTRREAQRHRALAHAIHMPAVLAEGQVVYFWLPVLKDQAIAPMIGKLALYSLVTAATERQDVSQDVYLFIDEFQTMASDNIKDILQQARSMGLSVLLANQTLSDLQTRQVNLINTVQDNTRLRLVLSVDNPQFQDALMKMSGETMYHLYQWETAWDVRGVAGHGESATVAVREQLGPRLTANDLQRLSASRAEGLVAVKGDEGLAQYGGLLFPLRMQYHITREEFMRRSQTPWPAPDDRTVVVADGSEAEGAATAPTRQAVLNGRPRSAVPVEPAQAVVGAPVHHGTAEVVPLEDDGRGETTPEPQAVVCADEHGEREAFPQPRDSWAQRFRALYAEQQRRRHQSDDFPDMD